jgi:hypothetical protein
MWSCEAPLVSVRDEVMESSREKHLRRSATGKVDLRPRLLSIFVLFSFSVRTLFLTKKIYLPVTCGVELWALCLLKVSMLPSIFACGGEKHLQIRLRMTFDDASGSFRTAKKISWGIETGRFFFSASHKLLFSLKRRVETTLWSSALSKTNSSI